MKRAVAFVLIGIAAAIVTVARGGHELPIYPSYYPHEIEIKVARARAARPRRCARERSRPMSVAVCAMSARRPSRCARSSRSAPSSPCASIRPPRWRRTRLRPAPPSRRSLRELAGHERFRPASLSGHAVPRRLSPSRRPRGRRQGALRRLTPRRSATSRSRRAARSRNSIRIGRRAMRTGTWRSVEVDAAGLMDAATLAMNGWIAPPWVRTGWFHAERLLADAISDPAAKAARRRRPAAAPGRRLQRAGRAHQPGTRSGAGAHRRLPQDRRRLHGSSANTSTSSTRPASRTSATMRSTACIRRSSSAR